MEIAIDHAVHIPNRSYIRIVEKGNRDWFRVGQGSEHATVQLLLFPQLHFGGLFSSVAWSLQTASIR